MNVTGAYFLNTGTTFEIKSGADFLVTDVLQILGDGTLVMDGAGSSVTTGSSTSQWGFGSNSADVTFRNSATGNLGGIDLARDTFAGTTGIFNVESGATVTTGSLNVATLGGATTTGTITVVPDLFRHQLLLVTLASGANRHIAQVIEYLVEENRARFGC